MIVLGSLSFVVFKWCGFIVWAGSLRINFNGGLCCLSWW